MRSEIRRALALVCLAVAPVLAQTRKLTILHTNDVHARLSPGANQLGGFAFLATAIEHERKGCDHCLLLNAGDLAQGSPVSTIFHGLPVFEIANLLHYDAATLGNHDFDYGWMQTRKFIQTANYPVVSANLVDDRGELYAKPYVILKVNGLKVAVIGAMTEDFKNLSTPAIRGPWHTTPFLEAVRKYAKEAREKADLVVLLAHISGEEEKAVLQEIPEVHVSVTGHLHIGMEKELTDGHRLVVRVRNNAQELGRLDLEVEPRQKEIASWKWTKIPVDATRLAPAPEVAAQVKKWEDEVTRRVDQPLAKSSHQFDKAGMKKLIERAMREMTGSDFAFMNSGGIRENFPAGQLLVRNVWNVMPFDNVVVFGKFKGKDLPPVVLEGRTVDPDREYTLAVSDFTAANQSAASQLQSKGLEFPGEGPLLRDVIVDWCRKQQTLD